MDYERMWNALKSDVRLQSELSDYINISKLIERFKVLEDTEKDNILGFKDGELPF